MAESLPKVVMTVVWKALPGSENAVADILRQMVEPTRAETGCLAYEVSRSVHDPATFLLYEVYEDQRGLDQHQASDHFQRLVVSQAMPLLESRKRAFYRPL